MLSENVRIKFAKVGKMKYISHLDLQRTMKTALKRAEIPVKYTEGFNPHPKLVFALTVSVGSDSVCEFLDIGLSKPISREDFINGWKNAMGEGLVLLDVYTPTTKFANIAYSSYDIVFDKELDKSLIDTALETPMIVKKHSKKGEKIEDIRSAVVSLSCDGATLKTTLAAAQGVYLNPEYLVKALADRGVDASEYQITRTGVYFADMTDFK